MEGGAPTQPHWSHASAITPDKDPTFMSLMPHGTMCACPPLPPAGILAAPSVSSRLLLLLLLTEAAFEGDAQARSQSQFKARPCCVTHRLTATPVAITFTGFDHASATTPVCSGPVSNVSEGLSPKALTPVPSTILVKHHTPVYPGTRPKRSPHLCSSWAAIPIGLLASQPKLSVCVLSAANAPSGFAALDAIDAAEAESLLELPSLPSMTALSSACRVAAVAARRPTSSSARKYQ